MSMAKKIIRRKIVPENTFEAGPSGGLGSTSYGSPWQTPGGGNITQNPRNFNSSNQDTNRFQPNTASGSAYVPTMVDRPGTGNNVEKTRIKTGYETGGGKIVDINGSEEDKDSEGLAGYKMGTQITSPAGTAFNKQADRPLNPDQRFDPQVDQLFKGKRHTPSPDEIMSALQYELSQMVKKDKAIAKQTVLKNLKTDPYYYSRLHMLNIDDEKMKVDETTVAKTKAVLDKMIAERKKNVAVANTPEITKIFKDLYDKRQSLRKISQP